MKILVDSSPIIISKNRGIGNYAVNLLRELLMIDKENEYYVLDCEDDGIFGEGFGNLCFVPFQWDEAIKAEYVNRINKVTGKIKPDVFYTPNAINLKYPILDKDTVNGALLCGTVHDIIPYVLKEIYFPGDSGLDRFMSYCRGLKGYDLLFANSETTKQDVCREFGCNNIINIQMGPNRNQFREDRIDKIWSVFRQNKRIEDGYMLGVLGTGPNKNLIRIIKAYCDACEQHGVGSQFVITGSLGKSVIRENISCLQKYLTDGRILFAGYVTDEEMEALYQHAKWCIFPTLYEGFGMPVVEAWNHGVPVMTSNNSSLNEIAHDAAVQVDPFDVRSLSEGFTRISKMSEKERQAYISAGVERAKRFSWEKTARSFLKEIRSQSVLDP